MCLSPVRIKNPRFVDLGYTGSEDGSYDHLPDISECRNKMAYHLLCSMIKSGETYIQNVSQATIQVPCGYCAECTYKRQNAITQRCYFESMNSWSYFVTLTYDNEHLPRCVDPYGREYTYADFRDIRQLFTRLRRQLTDKEGISYKFLVVSERGKKKHRPHFHMILHCPISECQSSKYNTPYLLQTHLSELINKFWSVNRGTSRKPVYESRYTYHEYTDPRTGQMFKNFDCHYIEPFYGDYSGVSKDVTSVAYYVSKYMNKADKFEFGLCRQFLAPSYSDSRKFEVSLAKPDGTHFLREMTASQFMKHEWRYRLSSHALWSKGYGATDSAREWTLAGWKQFLEEPRDNEFVPKNNLLDGLTEPVRISICYYYLDKYLSDEDKLNRFFLTDEPRTDFDSSYSYQMEDEGDYQKRVLKGKKRWNGTAKYFGTLFDDCKPKVWRSDKPTGYDMVDFETGEIVGHSNECVYYSQAESDKSVKLYDGKELPNMVSDFDPECNLLFALNNVKSLRESEHQHWNLSFNFKNNY